MAPKPFASSADLADKQQTLEVLADGVYALTAEGEELLAHGREILDRVSLARTTLRRMADQQSSTLRVSTNSF